MQICQGKGENDYKQTNQSGEGSLDKHWGHLKWEIQAERNVFNVHNLLFLKLISEDSIFAQVLRVLAQAILQYTDKPYNNIA